MTLENEPYRLQGRTVLIAGPVDELHRAVAAKLAAAGAVIVHLPAVLPLPAASIAAVESADVLVLQTLITASAAATAEDDWASINRLHQALVSLPTALLAKAAPAMRRRRWGRVIFLAGGDDATPAAIAVQSAQSALMQAEARQLAAAGITVNLIMANCDAANADAEVTQAIASAALYFAAKESSFVTGQTLQVGVDVLRK
jgi:NAD(P)-dependent dehydrogenase (short-subunit alcohol dehydrogenase family)